MAPWCEAFRRYVEREDIDQKVVAIDLDAAPSAVSYWMRGSVPRRKMRERIEKWSRGKVKASLAETKKKAA